MSFLNYNKPIDLKKINGVNLSELKRLTEMFKENERTFEAKEASRSEKIQKLAEKFDLFFSTKKAS